MSGASAKATHGCPTRAVTAMPRSSRPRRRSYGSRETAATIRWSCGASVPCCASSRPKPTALPRPQPRGPSFCSRRSTRSIQPPSPSVSSHTRRTVSPAACSEAPSSVCSCASTSRHRSVDGCTKNGPEGASPRSTAKASSARRAGHARPQASTVARRRVVSRAMSRSRRSSTPARRNRSMPSHAAASTRNRSGSIRRCAPICREKSNQSGSSGVAPSRTRRA